MNTPKSNTIGGRIAERRKQLNLRQIDLAERLLVKRETINQWENGLRQIKGEDIVRLADALETTTDYILRGIEPESVDIAVTTGLSGKAIKMLRDLAGGQDHIVGVQRYGYVVETKSVLSDLIASKYFHDFFNNIELYLISAGVLPDEAYKSSEQDLTVDEYSRLYGWAKGRGLEIIPRKEAADLYLQNACDALKDICKEMLENGKHSREKK